METRCNSFPDLCVVASKGLVDIARAEHQQSTAAAAGPWQQLREHVAKHHPEPRLDVLEGQILAGVCAAVGAEPRGLADQSDKELDEGVNHRVDGGIHCSRGSVTPEINRRDVMNTVGSDCTEASAESRKDRGLGFRV